VRRPVGWIAWTDGLVERMTGSRPDRGHYDLPQASPLERLLGVSAYSVVVALLSSSVVLPMPPPMPPPMVDSVASPAVTSVSVSPTVTV
jgi:hypothetical protein